MAKNKAGFIWFLVGLISFLIILVGGSYAFEFVQVFFSNALSSIGIVSSNAQKWTIVLLAFGLLFLFANRNIKKAMNKLFGRR